jgi:hypothetical protein
MLKETWGKVMEDNCINDVCHDAEVKSDKRNTGGSKPTPDDDEIVTALQKYFFEDEYLVGHFETFIDRNSYNHEGLSQSPWHPPHQARAGSAEPAQMDQSTHSAFLDITRRRRRTAWTTVTIRSEFLDKALSDPPV